MMKEIEVGNARRLEFRAPSALRESVTLKKRVCGIQRLPEARARPPHITHAAKPFPIFLHDRHGWLVLKTMMTQTLRCCVFALAVCLLADAGVARAQTVIPLKQGELLRSTTGRGIDSAGFASIYVPLKKGAIYDVVRQENGNVVLSVEGQSVMVQSSYVTVTEKSPPPVVKVEGFVPGKVVIISAKYSLEGNSHQSAPTPALFAMTHVIPFSISFPFFGQPHPHSPDSSSLTFPGSPGHAGASGGRKRRCSRRGR